MRQKPRGRHGLKGLGFVQNRLHFKEYALKDRERHGLEGEVLHKLDYSLEEYAPKSKMETRS